METDSHVDFDGVVKGFIKVARSELTGEASPTFLRYLPGMSTRHRFLSETSVPLRGMG